MKSGITSPVRRRIARVLLFTVIPAAGLISLFLGQAQLRNLLAPPAWLHATGDVLDAALGLDPSAAGLVWILDRSRQGVIAQGLTSTIRTADGHVYRFPADFRPLSRLGHGTMELIDEVLGPARRATVSYRSLDGALLTDVEITTARSSASLLYQLRVRPLAGETPIHEFTLFDAADGVFDLLGDVEYLTIKSVGPVQGVLSANAGELALPLSQGTPVLLWSSQLDRGYVIGVLDYTQAGALDYIEAGTRLELARSARGHIVPTIRTRPQAGLPGASPRLFMERVATRDPSRAFAGFRAVLDTIAPAPPVPQAFRQQWGTWYVYGAGLNEDVVREQIDVIAGHYGDLGPWQVVIDAGWYLSGGHPDGEIGVVDSEKFPSGMRSLVDYAHARGVGVVLYGSAPWVDSRPSTPSWWVVQLGFVRKHRDWLIQVEEDEEGAAYVYDLTNPGLRAYLGQVLRRYLVEFDADGILLDMVGVIGPSGGPFRGDPVVPREPRPQTGLAQTLEIYRSTWRAASRLKPEAWIEGGYAAPPLARPYAHTWRLADDYPAFSHPYPFAGLLEQTTYAILQQQLLGRRPHLGFIYGGADTLAIQRQWLGAAVALQAQTVLSVDLAHTPPETTRMYREYLAALRPFSGTSFYGPGTPPNAFSTMVDGTLYLGLLNPAVDAKVIAVDLVEHGLPAEERVLVYDPESRTVLSREPKLETLVPPRSFRLLVVRREAGVLWGDRSSSATIEGDQLRVRIDPSPYGAGRVWIYAPDALEYQVLGPRDAPSTYAKAAGLLVVRVPDGRAYEVRARIGRVGSGR